MRQPHTSPPRGVLLALALALTGCQATASGAVTPMPTATPGASAAPTAAPTAGPSAAPTAMPTATPAASASPIPSASPAGPAIPGATFTNPTAITNPFAPWGTLTEMELAGEEDGEPLRSVLKRLAETKPFRINGQTIQAVVIEDRAYEDDELVELTRDYFAQDDAGVVYYLGEDVDNYEDGKLKDHNGAWLFGTDTMTVGVFMPASPKLGDKFRPEDVPASAPGGLIREEAEVVGVGETVTVPAGRYTGCLRLKLVTETGEVETKIFAPGVGIVKESDPDAELTLRSRTGT